MTDDFNSQRFFFSFKESTKAIFYPSLSPSNLIQRRRRLDGASQPWHNT